MSGSGSQQEHWKHTWPCANVFGNFMCANSGMFKDKVVLELGSGATGVCGLTAAKLGAKKVYLTDHPKLEKALEMLKTNIQNNDVEPICEVRGLDWDDPNSVLDFLSKIENLDIIIASDVFFDPTTFIGIVRTISEVLTKFVKAKFWFAYQERDDNWTIAELLKRYDGLEASLIRKVETGKETIQIISIVKYVEDCWNKS